MNLLDPTPYIDELSEGDNNDNWFRNFTPEAQQGEGEDNDTDSFVGYFTPPADEGDGDPPFHDDEGDGDPPFHDDEGEDNDNWSPFLNPEARQDEGEDNDTDSFMGGYFTPPIHDDEGEDSDNWSPFLNPEARQDEGEDNGRRITPGTQRGKKRQRSNGDDLEDNLPSMRFYPPPSWLPVYPPHRQSFHPPPSWGAVYPPHLQSFYPTTNTNTMTTDTKLPLYTQHLQQQRSDGDELDNSFHADESEDSHQRNGKWEDVVTPPKRQRSNSYISPYHRQSNNSSETKLGEADFKIPALFKIRNCLSDIVVCKPDNILMLAHILDTYMSEEINGNLETYHQRIQTFYNEFTEIMLTVQVDIRINNKNPTILYHQLPVPIYTDRVNEIILTEKIKSGHYGDVWATKVNGIERYATKITKVHLTDDDKKKRNFANNLYELSIGVLLQCIRGDIIRNVHSDTTFEWPFPEIKFILHSKNTLDEDTGVICGMERLEDTLDDLNLIEFNDFIDIMLQLAHSFKILQSIIGFQHRDLHRNNVMYKKRDEPMDITLQVGNLKSITYTSYYRAFIIDIGQCCIDANKCAGCGVPIKTQIQATSRRTLWYKCDDENNDLHMLLVSIAGQVEKIKDLDQLQQYQDFFSMFRLNIYQLDPRRKIENPAAWKTIYSVDNSPNLFNPESVFDIIAQQYKGEYEKKDEEEDEEKEEDEEDTNLWRTPYISTHELDEYLKE